MVTLYIAGPYRDDRGEWYVDRNIRSAEAADTEIALLGAMPIVPHLAWARGGGDTLKHHLSAD